MSVGAGAAPAVVNEDTGPALFVRTLQPGAEVVGGYLPVMPSYRRPTSPEQRAALVAYVRPLGAP